MTIDIKHRKTGKTLFTCEAETVRQSVTLAVSEGVDLRWANLMGANLSEANLRWADLREADLREADLREADLRWADLREADLREADLSEADLREADLRWADLSEADLRWANLRGVDLRGANLNGAKTTHGVWSCTPITILGLRYPILITEYNILIGCKDYTTQQWGEFDDEDIIKMGGKPALRFWRENKEMLLGMSRNLLKGMSE